MEHSLSIHFLHHTRNIISKTNFAMMNSEKSNPSPELNEIVSSFDLICFRSMEFLVSYMRVRVIQILCLYFGVNRNEWGPPSGNHKT